MPFIRVSCVLKDNPSRPEQSMKLSVVRSTERHGEPCDMVSPPDMVVLHVVACADDAMSSIYNAHFHAPAAIEAYSSSNSITPASSSVASSRTSVMSV